MLYYLTKEEREPLREIFHTEFDSELPEDYQANIVAVVDDGIEAFVTTELLIRADMWWVREDLRDTTRSAKHILNLSRHLLKTIPRGTSVITLAGCDTHRKIFTKLGMRPIQGEVYRIDL